MTHINHLARLYRMDEPRWISHPSEMVKNVALKLDGLIDYRLNRAWNKGKSMDEYLTDAHLVTVITKKGVDALTDAGLI
jgi:hypothetical protein